MSLVFTPEGTPASPQEGEVYYDSTADKLKVQDASGFREVVSEDSSGAIRADVINEKTSANGVSIKSGSNIGITIDSNGYVTKPNQPFFCGRGNHSDANITGSYNAIIFHNNDVTNNAISQNSSTGKCGIPVAGKYMVNWTIGNQGNGNASSFLGISIFKNNGIEVSAWSINTGYDHTTHCQVILDLSTSDTVAFTYRTDYGTPPSSTALTVASIYLIG